VTTVAASALDAKAKPSPSWVMSRTGRISDANPVTILSWLSWAIAVSSRMGGGRAARERA